MYLNKVLASNGNRSRETPEPIPNSAAKPAHDMCVLPMVGKHIAVWHFKHWQGGSSVSVIVMHGRKALIEEIAKERIEILFDIAEREFISNQKLAKSYISMMNKIRTHYRVGIPSRIKNRICSNCSSILIPGYNCKVTIASSKGHIIYKCSVCGSEKHLHYRK